MTRYYDVPHYATFQSSGFFLCYVKYIPQHFNLKYSIPLRVKDQYSDMYKTKDKIYVFIIYHYICR
jgi:hypothetical protein